MGTKKEENKKDYTIVVIAIVVVIMIAWAVGVLLYNKGSNGGSAKPGENNGQEQAEPKKTESQETDFTQWVTDTIEGSYYIPSLIIDSDDARAINEEITKECADRPESEEDSGYGIGYNAYYNKGVLSLVLVKNDSKVHYVAYNIDTENGTRLSNKELLERFGATEEKTVETLKENAKNLYSAQYSTSEEGENPALEATVNEVSMDMPMYLDENTYLVSVLKLHDPESDSVTENLMLVGLENLK